MDPGEIEALHQGRHRARRAAESDERDEPRALRAAGEDADERHSHAPGGLGDLREAGGAGGAEGVGDDRGAEVRLVPVPGAGRAASLGVGARSVGGLLLVAVVVLVVLGGRWWWVEQQATAVPNVAPGEGTSEGQQVVPSGVATGEGSGEQAPTGGADDADGSVPAGPEQTAEGGAAPSPGGTTDPAAAGPVLVHVVGHVAAPGVVELRAGSRVVDAVDAAGGLTDRADPGSLNMARVVTDGEQIWVGAPGEEPPAGWAAGAPAVGAPSPVAPGSPAPGTEAPAALVDLNRATQAELEELPGIGPVTAGRILAWRQEHAGFTTVGELLEVSGIGERTLEQLEPLVTVGS